MTLFEVTREAAREAVQMYFEPITSLFGRVREHPVLVGDVDVPESFDQAVMKSSPMRRKSVVVDVLTTSKRTGGSHRQQRERR